MESAEITRTFRLAPEWAPQKAVWTAWPADPDEWNGDLDAPRRDIAAMIKALARFNRVKLLVNGAEAEQSALEALGDAAQIVPARYGDIWLRDTGPIFAQTSQGPVALRFSNNGWGGKFALDGDDTVGDDIARIAEVPVRRFPFVLEGGAIEHDGAGTFLTTRQTLLNHNRNGWTERDAEAALRDAFGARKVIWVDQGLRNDHTDGHIDNIARFVAPGVVACQAPQAGDDPNAAGLDAIARTLEQATDADDRPLQVVRIPGPGLVQDALGEIAPASHLNFVIANGVVVVPVYGTRDEDRALQALQELFPGREVTGIRSHGVLGAGSAGGGSFHGITREEPA